MQGIIVPLNDDVIMMWVYFQCVDRCARRDTTYKQEQYVTVTRELSVSHTESRKIYIHCTVFFHAQP